ncbi:putative methyltransferase-domain-containing protein [Kalaharituber pfeilii]|nr:putative methyltransferase-domain-containing protein [Kalaharituber pfeilii]
MNLFNDPSDSEVEPLSEELIPLAPRLEARITETDFDGLLSPPLRLHEDLTKGCGGQIWPAGNLLAKYVLRNYDIEKLKGKRAVELGAGGGLVGLAMASAFKDSRMELYITDQEPMMDLMRRNAELNNSTVRVELLNWGEPLPACVVSSPVDIVLAADCVYFEPAFPLLEQTLIDLVTEDTLVLFCFKKRRRADLRFMKSINKRLQVTEVTDYPEYEECSRESIFLYSMRKKEI